MMMGKLSPLALSLSKCAYGLEASLTCGRLRLDRLRTNGISTNGISTSLETNGVI